ncbi:MAG: hypothetical protein V4507_05220 [Verrucomicrobiota bacterium]
MKQALESDFTPPVEALSPKNFQVVEVESIDLFVRIAQFIGFPKSFGEIYGLLFTASEPLSLDDICERLNMSKGSASQGLKALRGVHAVKTTYVPGDRRDRFELEGNIRLLMQGFLQERLEPGIRDLGVRIESLSSKVNALQNGEKKRYNERLGKLRNWHKQAQKIMPAMERLLGG